jgi:16S rRNA (adenine1518-N6/adenine1519-N6)-dimethyltransferase
METDPKKSLGQHWLNDNESLEAICDAAAVKANDKVLEIGPGQGSLTKRLLNRGAKVIAVEYDKSLIDNLRDSLKGDIKIEYGDIRKYNFSKLPKDYKLVANIPYYLTSYLLRILTDNKHNKPAMAALLVQKEVAQRIAAKPGDMSLISIFAQYYYKVSLGQIISSNLFIPLPKVDSQILCLERRVEPLFTDIPADEFFQVVKAGFSQRRKTLVNNLIASLRLSKERAIAAVAESKLDLAIRAQALTLDNWYDITLKLVNKT